MSNTNLYIHTYCNSSSRLKPHAVLAEKPANSQQHKPAPKQASRRQARRGKVLHRGLSIASGVVLSDRRVAEKTKRNTVARVPEEQASYLTRCNGYGTLRKDHVRRVQSFRCSDGWTFARFSNNTRRQRAEIVVCVLTCATSAAEIWRRRRLLAVGWCCYGRRPNQSGSLS